MAELGRRIVLDRIALALWSSEQRSHEASPGDRFYRGRIGGCRGVARFMEEGLVGTGRNSLVLGSEKSRHSAIAARFGRT